MKAKIATDGISASFSTGNKSVKWCKFLLTLKNGLSNSVDIDVTSGFPEAFIDYKL